MKEALDAGAEVQAELPFAQTGPKEAELRALQPPAPAAPTHRPAADAAAQASVAAVAPPAVAARHAVQTRLLALAREIRRPGAYVGYSAFLLLGALKKCQPCVWEGAVFIDLLAA